MADGEVSNAELARRLADFAGDVRGDFTEVFRRLDLYVLRDVYAAEKTTLEMRIRVLETSLADERRIREAEALEAKRLREADHERQRQAEERQRNSVRWWWAAVVIPVLAMVVSALLQARGGA